MNNGSKQLQKTIIDTTTDSSFAYHAQQQSEQQQATIKAFGNEACDKRKAGRSPSDSQLRLTSAATRTQNLNEYCEWEYQTQDSLADLMWNSDMSHCRRVNSTLLNQCWALVVRSGNAEASKHNLDWNALFVALLRFWEVYRGLTCDFKRRNAVYVALLRFWEVYGGLDAISCSEMLYT